jgi:RNA polymerase sigma-70 factor (ECF subfamily)
VAFRKNNPGELQAYVESMISHQDKLHAFIYSLMPGSPDVHDVLQNTNAVLWQKRDQFKHGTNFLAWSFKIARYQVQHQNGRNRRDGRLVFSDKLIELITETTPADRSHDKLLAALDGCLAKLGEKQRELINERYTPGRSLEQLAANTGRTAGSLRIALHRIRELLKNCVEQTLAQESA